MRHTDLIEKSEEEVIGRGLHENPFNDFEFETQAGEVAEDMIPGGNPGLNLILTKESYCFTLLTKYLIRLLLFIYL